MHLGTVVRGRVAFWLLIALTVATRLAIAFADHRSLIATGVYSDDAFYYLRIAANVAHGRGLTFDGVSTTNGFHPLYLANLLPIMALVRTDLVLPIHLAGVVLTAWAVGTAVVLHAWLTDLTGRTFAFFGLLIWAMCPYFVIMSVNGLETGVAATFILLVPRLYIAWFCDDAPPRPARALTFGAVCGLGILARVDVALLLAAVVVDWLARHARRPRAWVGSAGQAAAAAAVVWLPWALVSRATTGYWLPSSGAASRQIALNLGWLKLQPMWTDLAAHGPVFDIGHVPAAFHADVATRLVFVFLFEHPLLAPLRANVPAGPWAELDGYSIHRLFLTSPAAWTALVLLAVAVAAAVVAWRRRSRAPASTPTHSPRATLRRIAGVYLVLIWLGYTFYSPTHWYFNRYLAGPILLTMVYVLGEVWSVTSRRPGLMLATVAAALAIGTCQLAEWRFARALRWSDAPPEGFLATWLALGPKVAPHERVAAFQAGTYGYFSGRDVINLDGKVNQDAFVALKNRRLHDYIAEQNIRYIMDGERMLWALCVRHAPPGTLPIQSVAVDPNGSGVQLFQVGDASRSK